MALSFLYLAFVRILQLLRLSRRDVSDLAIEVVMLRHEVAVLRRQAVCPALPPPDLALLAGLSRFDHPIEASALLRPARHLAPLLREPVRRKWTYRSPRAVRVSPRGLFRWFSAWPKRTWGYRRIHGELSGLGIVLAPASASNILQRYGLDPSPQRAGPT
jgi:putative transposase